MTEKNLNVRIINKHDTEENWVKATNFVPKQGELIVYDIDATHPHERFKIGDGVTFVNDLPFYACSWNNLLDRPFYDNSVLTLVREEETHEWTEDNSSYNTGFRPTNGTTYAVIWDGVEYECTATRFGAGDVQIIEMGDDDDPFSYTEYNLYAKTAGTHTFTIYEKEINRKQLDEIFVPDTIARVADIPEIDDTLSVGGAAADAEAVGEALATKSDIDHTHDAVFLRYEECTLPAELEWTDVAYGNGMFVTIAKNSNQVAYSADGVVWTIKTLPYTAEWSFVTYGDDKFVAISTNSTYGAYSYNGISWSRAYIKSGNWCGLTYYDGEFVAIQPDTTASMYSNTGINWYNQTLSTSAHYTDMYIVPNVTKAYMMVASGSTYIYRSIDSTNVLTDTHGFADINLVAVAGRSGLYIALGDNNGRAIYSTNGEAWTETTIQTHSWSKIVDGGDKFVTVAANSNVAAYTTDGATWVETTLPVTANWSAVTYGNGVYVAVAQGSNIAAFSRDGITWLQVDEGIRDKDGADVAPRVARYLTDLRPRIATVDLPVANWTGGSNNLYSQVVAVNTVTANTLIEINPSATQILAMQNDEVVLTAENVNGTVTFYAINKPTTDFTSLQLRLEEVSYV